MHGEKVGNEDEDERVDGDGDEDEDLEVALSQKIGNLGQFDDFEKDQTDDELKKVGIVLVGDAVVEPNAVMVEDRAAPRFGGGVLVAALAVLGSLLNVGLADEAVAFEVAFEFKARVGVGRT